VRCRISRIDLEFLFIQQTARVTLGFVIWGTHRSGGLDYFSLLYHLFFLPFILLPPLFWMCCFYLHGLHVLCKHSNNSQCKGILWKAFPPSSFLVTLPATTTAINQSCMSSWGWLLCMCTSTVLHVYSKY
jgi:hypothetical protein